jgi:antirestriction protein
MPSIYISNLALYTQGRENGKWIDVQWLDAEQLEEEVTAKVGPSEEFIILDTEGFDGIDVDQYASFEWLAQVAELIENRDPALIAHFIGEDVALDNIEDEISDQYRGTYPTAYDWARECVDNNMTQLMGALKGVYVGYGNQDGRVYAKWLNDHLDAIAKDYLHDAEMNGLTTVDVADGVAILNG